MLDGRILQNIVHELGRFTVAITMRTSSNPSDLFSHPLEYIRIVSTIAVTMIKATSTPRSVCCRELNMTAGSKPSGFLALEDIWMKLQSQAELNIHYPNLRPVKTNPGLERSRYISPGQGISDCPSQGLLHPLLEYCTLFPAAKLPEAFVYHSFAHLQTCPLQ